MSREIKFRAWNFLTGEMEYGNYFHFYPNGNIESQGYDTEGEDGKPAIAVMQYTGLKDKNGKEIFEGDIIETDGSILNREVVEYIDCEYPMLRWSGDQGIKESSRIEVIGNTYENPELLK